MGLGLSGDVGILGLTWSCGVLSSKLPLLPVDIPWPSPEIRIPGHQSEFSRGAAVDP